MTDRRIKNLFRDNSALVIMVIMLVFGTFLYSNFMSVNNSKVTHKLTICKIIYCAKKECVAAPFVFAQKKNCAPH